MPTQVEQLGSKLYILALKLKGTLPKEQMADVLERVVEISGMSTAGMLPAVWTYPLESGQGGLGNTICQPLVESFLISDDWPDLGHTYVILASCRHYDIQEIISFLAKAVGPVTDIKILEI